MQKKLIALAIAGMIAAPAFAQSNVTVYGIIDTYVGYGKAGDDKFTGVGSGVLSGARLGFKGSEDLGNGLKAVFVLEQGFNSDNASSSSTKEFHRQAWVGLQGGFGFLGLGRQYAPGYDATAAFSAVSAGALDPIAILTSKLSVAPGTTARWDDSVVYSTKNFGGFSAKAIYSFTGSDNGTESGKARSDDNDYGLGLNYANGPLAIGYVFQKTNAADVATPASISLCQPSQLGAAATPSCVTAGDVISAAAKTTQGIEQKEHYIGASYDFGSFKLIGSYQTADVDTGVKATENDIDVYYVGAVVPVGSGNIHVAYGARNEDLKDMDSRSFGLAYTHSLSKRTTAYVGVNRTTNNDKASLGSLAKDAGESSTGFGVGIRHAF